MGPPPFCSLCPQKSGLLLFGTWFRTSLPRVSVERTAWEDRGSPVSTAKAGLFTALQNEENVSLWGRAQTGSPPIL